MPKKSGEGAASDLRGSVRWAIGRPGSRFLGQVLIILLEALFVDARLRVGGALMRGTLPH